MKQHDLAVILSKFYLRIGRGHNLVDFLVGMVKNIVYLGALGILCQKWFGFQPPTWILISIGIGFEIGCYTLGYIDEKKGFWRFQNSYVNKQLNPFFEEMSESLKRIEDRL